MKNKFIVLIVAFLIVWEIQSQNVGIGTTTPLAQLSVGSSSQFRVNSTGNIIRINNLIYSFPSVQGTNQYLKNDGAGNLTWAPVSKPVIRVFSLAADGTSNWLIDNAADYASGSNADPTIALHRGFTYQFSNFTGHPFHITSTPGTGSYAVGISGNGTSNGIVIFTVPMDAPATLYYYCSLHPSMNGTITIL